MVVETVCHRMNVQNEEASEEHCDQLLSEKGCKLCLPVVAVAQLELWRRH